AVTACPTGIAHTYMARDALKKQAEKMGVKIKVETNGSGGIKNHLTNEDIERANGVIVAADVHVETARFNGKNRSEEHTSELQSRFDLVCRLLLEKKKRYDVPPTGWT